MTDRWRIGANLATLANGLLGVGAVLYTLAGNPLWAMLLIVSAIGFDGLDGLLSRRSPEPPTAFGRVADSVADATTFGVAPAFLIAVHTSDVAAWHPYAAATLAAGAVYLAAALARLTYFTTRAHTLPHFLGIPTPQSAIALVVVLLFHDVPAFVAVAPIGVLVGVAILAATMVAPIPYPKIRRGSRMRGPAVAAAACAAVTLTALQFRPAPGSGAYLVAEAAAYGLLVAVAIYYLLGPFTTGRSPAEG